MSLFSGFERRFIRFQFGGKQRLRVYRKIIRLLQNGVALPAALEGMWNLASNDGKKPKNPEALVIDAWLRQVRNGKSLGVAIQGWVPETDRVVIEAGEASGDLPSAVENACFLHESQKKIRGAVISGLAYPLALVAVVIVFLFIFGLQVLPQFETALPRDRWTGVGEQMASLSDFVQTWLAPSIVAFMGLVGLCLWSMPRWTGKLRVAVEKAPPYSIYKLVAGSGFLLSLAALTKAGVKQTTALRSIMRDSRPWYHERLSRTLYFVNNGMNIGEALHKTNLQFPDKETVSDLRTYASLNGFDDMLMRLGRENLEDTIERIKAQSKIMNYAGIVLMAVVMAWLFMGIQSIQQQIMTSL